ncbi:hypothetical protein HZH68_003272 [Vespula germanica]|uniref:Uncharacterized protein n=1 Tax=Vespula germanica TaxID=30212 RepID=A0A834NNT2_VESGE|nr:hypothetical protein HZH68_003272 [Vespula germanica]
MHCPKKSCLRAWPSVLSAIVCMKNQCDPPPSPPPPPPQPPSPASTPPNQTTLKREFTNEVGDLTEEERYPRSVRARRFTARNTRTSRSESTITWLSSFSRDPP